MTLYRIAAHGRQYFCEAETIATALRHFADNVAGIATETLTEISPDGRAKLEQSAPITLLPKRKPGRRATR